jgi:tellurium resistance protein TerD
MGVNLTKGGRVNLSKESSNLSKIGIGLGWDINQHSTSGQYDIDTSVFMLTSSGKVLSDEYFIFYNNLKSPDGAVEHTGDNRTGVGDSDDETIFVHLNLVNPAIQEILFVTTIHEAEVRRQNFGMIRNAYLRIYDVNDHRELAKYDLDEDFSYETSVEIGRLYRKDGEWRFMAVGQGSKVGLQGLVDKYI